MLTLIVLLVSAGSFYLWLVTAKIPVAYLNVLEDSLSYGNYYAVAQGGTLYLFLVRLSWPMLVLLLMYLAPNRFWFGIAILAWSLCLAIFIMSGNRTSVFSLLASTFVVYYLRHGRRPGVPALLLILALFVFISGFLVSARGRGGLPDDIQYLNELSAEITDRGAATGLMAVVSVFPERSDYLGLRALSDVIYAPVPRALWPAKPSLRPVQDTLDNYLSAEAHAPGVIGIYYAAFGHFGPLIVLFFFGALSALIFENWRKNPQSIFSQLLLAGWIPFLWVLIHRGELSKQVVEIMYRFGPILLIYFLTRAPAIKANGDHDEQKQ